MGVETYTIHIVNKMIYTNTKNKRGEDRWHFGTEIYISHVDHTCKQRIRTKESMVNAYLNLKKDGKRDMPEAVVVERLASACMIGIRF